MNEVLMVWKEVEKARRVGRWARIENRKEGDQQGEGRVRERGGKGKEAR